MQKPDTLNLYRVSKCDVKRQQVSQMWQKTCRNFNPDFWQAQVQYQTFRSVPKEVLCVPFVLSPVLSAVIPENKWWRD